jgi:GTP cyclohydrolase FolE2
MKWLNAIFPPKPESSTAPVTKACHPVVYTLGWEIYTKDGARMSRRYEAVEESESKDIIAKLREQVAGMHTQLEDASRAGRTFVNLEGTVLRVSDVSKVTVFQQEVRLT